MSSLRTSTPLESDEAYGFSDFPYIVVSEAEEKEDLARMAKDECGLKKELDDAAMTIDIALELSDEEEPEEIMYRVGSFATASWTEFLAERERREGVMEVVEWSDDEEEDLEEMYRDGAVWAAELDREEAERQRRQEEKARADEERAKLDAVLDAEFEVVWIKYLAKKEREEVERMKAKVAI
jgi:hypothetical protein